MQQFKQIIPGSRMVGAREAEARAQKVFEYSGIDIH